MTEQSKVQARAANRVLSFRQTFDAESHDIRSVVWSPNGRALLIVAGNSQAWLWNPVSGETIWRAKHGFGVSSCPAWSPTGRYWLAGTQQGEVLLCGATEGTRHQTYRGLSGAVIGVGWDPTEQTVMAISGDGGYAKWDLFSGRLHKRIVHGIGTETAARWSPNLSKVAITRGDGRIECRNVADWSLAWAVNGEWGTSNCVAWSPDASLIACATEGGIRVFSESDAAALWSSRSHLGDHWRDIDSVTPPLRTLSDPMYGATWADFSADGTVLAARTRPNALLIWRCHDWDLMASQENVDAKWTFGAQVACHPSKPLIAVVSCDSVINVWEVASAKLPA